MEVPQQPVAFFFTYFIFYGRSIVKSTKVNFFILVVGMYGGVGTIQN